MAPEQESSLRKENQRLRERLQEMEDTLNAIRAGEVDALVDGGNLFTLESAESASNRFRGQVLQQITDSVIAVDNDHHITYLNEAAERQYGVQATDVLGKRLRAMYEYRWLRPEDESLALVAIREKGYWRGENIHVRLDGSLLHVESVVCVLLDGEGKPMGYLAVMRDLSETIKAQHVLEEASRQKDHFLATLAHELRNPLSPLMNGLQLLETGDPAVVNGAREMMQRQLGNMVRLVDDLMDMSRITRGKLELRKEPVDLGKVLATALETSRPLIERNEHELHVQSPNYPLWVNGDGVRLAQIISNLLNNAAKYTPAGGRIQVEVRSSPEGLLLSVQDNGIGITADSINKIFDMFAQVDGAMPEAGGLGIGLNIAQRLAHLHGGTLTAHSAGAGKGSTFTLLLPALAQAAPGRSPGAAQPARARLAPRRILVVDDNHDGADTMVLLLRTMGHTVQVAYDGKQALEAGPAFRPQLVLMDLGMPVMTGYEACEHMRKEPWGQGARIVAVSGWGQPKDRERSQRAGFDEHIIKPIERETLLRVLRDCSPEQSAQPVSVPANGSAAALQLRRR